jgi:hypothetical protein
MRLHRAIGLTGRRSAPALRLVAPVVAFATMLWMAHC